MAGEKHSGMDEHGEERVCIFTHLRRCNILDTLNEIFFCLLHLVASISARKVCRGRLSASRACRQPCYVSDRLLHDGVSRSVDCRRILKETQMRVSQVRSRLPLIQLYLERDCLLVPFLPCSPASRRRLY